MLYVLGGNSAEATSFGSGPATGGAPENIARWPKNCATSHCCSGLF